MAKERKARKHCVVAFRVTQEEYALAETKADQTGISINDWAREVFVAELGHKSPLTPNEQIMFEELARLRFLIGSALGHSLSASMTDERWAAIKKESDEKAAQHARTLLSRYESRWFFGDGEAHPKDPKVMDEGGAGET